MPPDEQSSLEATRDVSAGNTNTPATDNPVEPEAFTVSQADVIGALEGLTKVPPGKFNAISIQSKSTGGGLLRADLDDMTLTFVRNEIQATSSP